MNVKNDSHGGILILAFSALNKDPRVLREIKALKEICAVTAAGFSDPEISGVEFIQLEPRVPSSYLQRLASKVSIVWRFGTHRYLQYYWGQPCIQAARKKLERNHFDLVVANDIETLPLALEVAGDAPVLFDAHEYAPLQYEHSPKIRALDAPYKYFLCRQFIPKTAAFITVAAGIAEQYRMDTGVAAQVITNAPEYVDNKPRWVPDNSSSIELVHHGVAIRGRRLELLIGMMKHLDPRYRLTLMLVPSDVSYFRELKKRAAGHQIFFRDPVPFGQIIPTLTSYDVGLSVIYPGTFNYRHCLPNKFFEFVQARLAVVAGPSPEMAPIINQYRLGVVAQDFTSKSLAAAVVSLTIPDINEHKLNSDSAARELSAECNLRLLQDIARRLLERRKRNSGDYKSIAPGR